MIRPPTRRTAALFPLLLALAGASPLAAQRAPSPADAAAMADSAPTYTDTVDLVLAAPVIADATIASTVRIKGAEATGLAANTQRFYVQADVAALIRGAAGLPPRIGYLLDVPLDARGRAPKLRKRRVLLFARPVAGAADQLQLVGPTAQVDWSAAADARTRSVAQGVVAPDAPPAIIGIGSAFHVPGSLPGEGETQIFLQTADRRPVSLSILRRPGERPRWSVALSEIVDEAAAPPGPDTLLRYRLACGLPPALPPSATAALEPADAAAAREDYGVVVDALGPCGRRAEGGGVTAGGAPA